MKQKVGQLFFIGLPTDQFDSNAERIIADISPGGVCLFARNCKRAEDIRELLDSVRRASLLEPFLSLDQEGGPVDRLRRVAEPMPSARDIASSDSVGIVVQHASITGRLVRMLGFNMNFAPVLDIIDLERQNNSNGALYSRSFGGTPGQVVTFAGAYAESLWNEGIMPCHKHFPGIGGIMIDSHEDLPSVDLTREALFSGDLIPFIELLPADHCFAVMTGHTIFPDFDLQETDDTGVSIPTSLSRSIVTGLLREELGFQGLSLTDDLEMGAILRHYGMSEAAKRAVLAGNDFLLICNDPEMIYEGFEAVLKAVECGEISESRLDESVKRISAARAVLTAPPDFRLESVIELSNEIVELKQDI